MTDETGRGVLSVVGLRAGYGSMGVVRDVSMDVRHGELIGLVGRNGAGKSTTVNALAGLRFGPTKGEARFDGLNLLGLDASEIMYRGVSLVPAGHRIFAGLTVRENLLVGRTAKGKIRGTAATERIEQAYDLFPPLKVYDGRGAGLLSGGQQQMLAIGQALMSDPKVLMLDEPTSGLALGIIEQIYSVMRTLTDRGLALLVIEQNVRRALKECDFAYVMEGGRVVLEGQVDQLQASGRAESIVRFGDLVPQGHAPLVPDESDGRSPTGGRTDLGRRARMRLLGGMFQQKP